MLELSERASFIQTGATSRPSGTVTRHGCGSLSWMIRGEALAVSTFALSSRRLLERLFLEIRKTKCPTKCE